MGSLPGVTPAIGEKAVDGAERAPLGGGEAIGEASGDECAGLPTRSAASRNMPRGASMAVEATPARAKRRPSGRLRAAAERNARANSMAV